MLRRIMLLMLLLIPTIVSAQERCGLAYYDLGALYDTLPSPFRGDTDYTPAGRRHWNGARYRAAVERYAALIDELQMPMVALFGVENESVALDLAAHSQGDYAVVHRTSNRMDGLDFALLYQADKFFPHRVESNFGILIIEGELGGHQVALLLCNERERLLPLLEQYHTEYPEKELLVAGITGRRLKGFPLQDALQKAERAGRGSCRSRSGWWMRDRLWLSSGWELLSADVYARQYLFDPATGAPLPLYDGARYRGGWSRNLPVFVYFRPTNLEN